MTDPLHPPVDEPAPTPVSLSAPVPETAPVRVVAEASADEPNEPTVAAPTPTPISAGAQAPLQAPERAVLRDGPAHGRPSAPLVAPGRVRVAVHNGHCHKYAICQQEAPEVFVLRSPTRLSYDAAPPVEQTLAVRQAARLCPMQAISVSPR